MTTALSIVSSAYRATLEEQDDTILWLNSMLATSGVDVSILLQRAAVNYAVHGQDASGLQIGKAELAHPPRFDDDLAALIARGLDVYIVREDLDLLGVADDCLVDGVRPVERSAVPTLLDGFDHVWAW